MRVWAREGRAGDGEGKRGCGQVRVYGGDGEGR